MKPLRIERIERIKRIERIDRDQLCVCMHSHAYTHILASSHCACTQPCTHKTNTYTYTSTGVSISLKAHAAEDPGHVNMDIQVKPQDPQGQIQALKHLEKGTSGVQVEFKVRLTLPAAAAGAQKIIVETRKSLSLRLHAGDPEKLELVDCDTLQELHLRNFERLPQVVYMYMYGCVSVCMMIV